MQITTDKYIINIVKDRNWPAIWTTTLTRLIDGRVLHCDLPLGQIQTALPALDEFLDGFMHLQQFPLLGKPVKQPWFDKKEVADLEAFERANAVSAGVDPDKHIEDIKSGAWRKTNDHYFNMLTKPAGSL